MNTFLCGFQTIVVFWLALASPLHVSAQTAQARTRVPTPHVLPTLGGRLGVAHDINDWGVVAGESSATNNSSPQQPNVDPPHACLWRNGVPSELGSLLPRGSSTAYAINNRGQAVGASTSSSGWDHAVLWDRGVITDLGSADSDPDPGYATQALDINERGQIVGVSGASAVVWERGKKARVLPAPDGARSRANAINNRGQIVGTVNLAEIIAVTWIDGELIEIGTLPGGTFSLAQGINDRGQVVGYGDTPGDRFQHAFVWEDGVMTDLGTLAESSPGYSIANDINYAGLVVGQSGSPLSESNGAVLWRPNGVIVGIGLTGQVTVARAVNVFGVIAGNVGSLAAIWY